MHIRSCSNDLELSPADAGWAVVSWLRRCCWLFQWDVSVVILSYHDDLIPWEERRNSKTQSGIVYTSSKWAVNGGVGTVEVTVH